MQALINRLFRAAKPTEADRFDFRLGKLMIGVPAHLPMAGTTVFKKTA